METLTCEQCGRQFDRPRFQVHRDHKRKTIHVYCSPACRGIAWRRRVVKQCAECGKIFEIPASDDNTSKSGRYFCTKTCSNRFNARQRSLNREIAMVQAAT